MFQETLGGPRGPQALDELASDKCAPRFSGSATFRKHTRGAEARRHFALSRAMCTASHSCHAFRKADDKTGHAERKNGDFVLVFYNQDGRARIDVRAGCAPRPIPGTHFASSTTRQAMLRGKALIL